LRQQLTLLVDSSDLDEVQKELARAWRNNLEVVHKRAFAPLSIAFLSAVGRGKSTLIAAATGLRLETENPALPKKWSVLPVGAGRTTLGEIRIEFDSVNDIVLRVEPLPRRALETEIRIFAQDQFDAAHKQKSTGGDDAQPGEELAKLLQNWLAPNTDDPHNALRLEAERAESPESLENQWLTRIDFDARCRVYEESFPTNATGLQELKNRLSALMKGTLANAPVPATTLIRMPPGELATRVAAIIDTQGIDDGAKAWIKGRADLRAWLDNPNSLLVVCTAFEDAPDPVSRSVLLAIQEILGQQALRERAVRLVIVDKRPKDDDPEEHATELRQKLQQCHDKLHREGIELPEHAVVAIDVRDGAAALQSELNAMAMEGRAWRLNVLEEATRGTEDAMGSLRDHLFAMRARELDLRLWWEWDAELIRSQRPTLDGFAALGKELPGYTDYYWSQMHASVRRRGHYPKLDLALLGSGFAAAHAAAPYHAALARLGVEAARIIREDKSIDNHIAMRMDDFAIAIQAYQYTIKTEWQKALTQYFASPQSDELWTWCVNRWGGGKGYLAEVIQRIGQESERAQLSITISDTVEQHLPQRPELFSLRKIELTNFRGVAQSTHQLGHTTVFIGDNGRGKTCLLEAIAATIGIFLSGVGAGHAPILTESDVREVLKRMGDLPDRQRQLPMRVEVEGIVEGYPLTWGRHIDHLSMTDAVNTDDALQLKARKAGEEIRKHSMRQLPVLVYYGTQRLWPPDVEPKSDVGSNRLDGYRDCLNPAATQKHLLGWMKKYTFVELQRKKPVPQLQAIRRAVVKCIEGAKDFRYEVDLDELVLEMDNGECPRFRTLSDGYRNMVAMVADIAWRASVLNPQLLDRAPNYAEGVVLIDEIDLHLHPKWQRRVLADLRRVFPRLQFIATTHSPFIVQSLEPGQLVNLDDGAGDIPYSNESPEDIAENLMGVDVPQRSDRRKREYEAAKRYYDLLEKVPAADPVELAKLKAELDEAIAPYADNQAFVAFLERQRLLAEKKRG
ncbi:MAG TPA: AAA family ATPase, partial [Polyangium sp.]|nr:AAA family ATPase [Polyangium sp.]